MRKLYLLIPGIFVLLNLHAGNVFKVRTAPGTGEYATITAALAACADNAADRDTIDILGVFTESVNVNKSVVVRGHGWDESIIQAFASAPVVASPPAQKNKGITVNTAGKNVLIENLTVRYGYAAATGGGILIDKVNGGKVVLNKVKVSENYSETYSGGIAIIGSNVDVLDCYITNNRSKTSSVGGAGGGMHILSSNSGTDSKVNIFGTTIANNLTDYASGGGLSVDGNTTSGNQKLLEVNIVNSTIAFNESKTLGAGFFARGTPYTGTPAANTNVKIWMNHCTIAYNKVTTIDSNTLGVGLVFANVSGTTGIPVFDVHNTIITKNEVYVDETTNKNDVNFNKSAVDSVTNCIFGVTFNLTSATSNINNKTGKFNDVKLDTDLRLKGSVVPVLPILAGSIAIDSIRTNYASVTKDQRGVTRDSYSDIGAYEKALSILATSSDNAIGSLTGSGKYDTDESALLVATASSENHFVNWTENGVEVSTNATYAFTVSESRTLVANFAPDVFNIASGVTDAADIPYTTSDITVASGAELTVAADKTLKSVSVAAGGKLTISGGVLTTPGGITINSDASGTATINDNYAEPTISAVVKQQVEAGRNWYLSSPISNGNASVLSRGDSVVHFNEALKKWEKVTGSLTVGRGYIQAAVATQGTSGTIDFNGLTNSGTIPVAVTRTESGTSRGFNLVGNPYPSYLDWSKVIADPANSDIGTTFWYRTKNTSDAYVFVTHNGTSGEVVGGTTANTTITKFIPPMQAFWVRVKQNSGQTTYSTSITFKNTMRAHRDQTGNILKAPGADDRMRLRLQVSNGTSSDESLLYFDENAQNSFDDYDSPKMFANVASRSELFTRAGTERLVINGMNTIPYDTKIPIGFITGVAGNFSISGTELTNFPSGTRILLNDNLNATEEIELTEGVSYTFSSDPTTSTSERFSLIFRSPGVATEIQNVNTSMVQVLVDADNKLIIKAPVNTLYAIYNSLGQLIEKANTSANLHKVNRKLTQGIYVVKAGVGHTIKININ